MKLRPAVVVGAGVGIAGAAALAVHSAPSLVALSWLGRHVSPGLAGVGVPGHVALTFDDGPDPASTPEVPRGARRPRLARHVLHARRHGAPFARSGRRRRRRRSRGRGARRHAPLAAPTDAGRRRRRHRPGARRRGGGHRVAAALVPAALRHAVARRDARRAPGRDSARCSGPHGVATGGPRRRRRRWWATSSTGSSTAARCCCTTRTARRHPSAGTRRSARCRRSRTSSTHARCGSARWESTASPVPIAPRRSSPVAYVFALERGPLLRDRVGVPAPRRGRGAEEPVAVAPSASSRWSRHPMWLFGIALDVGAYFLEALALANGSIVLVQTLLVSGLLFALPLSAIGRADRPGRKEWFAAAAVAGGIAVFLAVGDPDRRARARDGARLGDRVLDLRLDHRGDGARDAEGAAALPGAGPRGRDRRVLRGDRGAHQAGRHDHRPPRPRGSVHALAGLRAGGVLDRRPHPEPERVQRRRARGVVAGARGDESGAVVDPRRRAVRGDARRRTASCSTR